MNKLLFIGLLTSVALSEPVIAQTATQQPTAPTASQVTLPTPIVGLVEQATMDKSDASKSIMNQLETKRTEVQKEMQKYEKELKDQDQKLTEEQKKLPEKEFATKRQAFEKRVREIQQKLEIRRAQMELAFEDAKKKVYDSFIKAADEVRTETGANLILYKETVVTSANSFDLTNKVLERLNKLLPSVQMTFKSEDEVKKQLEQMQQQMQQPQQTKKS
jgi:Skp family chaperone for outer membrane proteins